MTKDNWLALFILSILGLAGWIALTRKEQEGDVWDNIEGDWWG